MQAQIMFAFPFNTSAHDAITAVAAHFGATVAINGGAPEVPAHIKQAVENTASALGGQEMSPAMAFAGLINGDAGNASAAPHAHCSAGAATSTTAHAANPATSQITPPALSDPAQAGVNAGTAPGANAAPTNPAANGVEFDSTGLAWDERIHSGNKTKSPKGEWRMRKGTDKALVKGVEAELRAKYPNGAGGTATSPGNGAPNAPADVAVTIDPTVKRQQAALHAHTEALRVAGPQIVDDKLLAELNAGKTAQLTPQQNEWYMVYFAKRNAAFTEYMAGNVARVTPTVPPAPPTTGSAPDASAVTGNGSVASQTAAVGQPAATTASHGELDATGLPHDTRINVAAKIKDTAGVWVQRHDVAPQVKLEVMAELRAALAGNGAAQASNGATDPAGSSAAATPPSVAAVTAEEAGKEFPKLLRWIVANQMAGRITPTAGPDAAKQLGFADASGNGTLATLNAPEYATYLPYVVQILQQQGAQ